MDNAERTPLLVGENRQLPHSPQGPHSTTSVPTATKIVPVASTPPAGDANDDTVDGILFNNSPHLTGRGTPDILTPNVHVLPHLYSNDDDLFTSLSSVPPRITVYRTRFYILATFSFMAMFQCLMWNTWGPLSASVDAAFPGWSSSTVAMMSNWGTITFVLFVAPMCWLMNTQGLRAGVLMCAALIAAGTVLRIVPLILSNSTTFFTVMCHLCAILVGTAGTLVMAAPPMIAAVWFPPKERTTATAFVQVLNQLGNTGSYLEPLVVREPSSPHPSPEEVLQIQTDIKRLMYIWAGVGVVMAVVLVVYFPSKPPSPPSLTSHVERLDFRASLKMMFRNRDLLLVTVSYGLTLGVPSAWASVLNYSLYDLGMTQDDAMWVGLSATLLGAILALVAGRFTDLVYGHIKLSIILLLSLNLAAFYWFFLLTWGSISVSTWQIYVTVVGGLSLNFCLSPLFFELAVESAYPCSEVMVGGIITALNNFVGLSFLFLFLVPFHNYQWVTYVLLTTLGAAHVPLMFVHEDYSRSSIDRNNMDSAYQPI